MEIATGGADASAAKKCGYCGHDLPPDEIDCLNCGASDPDRRRRAVEETVAEELKLFDVLIVTDAGDELALHEHRANVPGARVVPVSDPHAPFDDRLALAAARAGKRVVTWCTPTDHGCRVARETAKTLTACMPTDKRVRHIVGVAPTDWHPLLDPFDALVAGARATPPSSPRPATTGSRAPDKDRWNTSPRAVARILLQEHAGRILAVSIDPAEKPENQHPNAYALDEKTGLWDKSTTPWIRWCFALAARMREELRRSGLEGRVYAVADSSIRRIERPSAVKELRRAVLPAADELRDEGHDLKAWGLTRCKLEDLDANLRYIGARNGVIDLDTGKLLDPEDGRKALVTLSTLTKFVPGACHSDVDRLFGHLLLEEQIWWWSVLGYHLRGGPSGRVYLVKGPPNGGKSTLAEALRLTLGPYASTPAFGAIEERRYHSETELSPGVHAFTAPRRFALIDEVKTKRINNRLVKDLSGGGSVTYRLLNQNLQTRAATATMLMFCNAGSEPRLFLEDQGMQRRYRELTYLEIPKDQIDPTFIRERIRSDDFLCALLARLVAEAAKAEGPPNDVPSVAEATAERIREDVGELGEFARRIVPGGDDVLKGSDVWEAWCQHVDEAATEKEAGGINKRGMASALRSRVNGLPSPKLYSVSGDKVRGWRNWRLLTVEEAQDQTPQAAEIAKQAINDLVGLLSLTEDQRQDMKQELTQKLMVPEALAAIDKIYGKDIDQALKGSLSIAYGPNGEEWPGMRDSLIAEGIPERQAAAVQRVHAIASCATCAQMTIEAQRPKIPAFQQALDRYHVLSMVTMGREDRAINYLTLANRDLGVDATAAELATTAVNWVKADAVNMVHGEEGEMVFSDQPVSHEEARHFEAATEAAIKELCGIG